MSKVHEGSALLEADRLLRDGWTLVNDSVEIIQSDPWMCSFPLPPGVREAEFRTVDGAGIFWRAIA
jgi:hypothetical protein